MTAPRLRPLQLMAALALIGLLLLAGVSRWGREAGAAGQDGWLAPGPAAPAQNNSEEEKAVRKANAAYLDALNQGNLDARLALWAADADYIDEDGKVTRGRDALAALMKGGQADLKGTKFAGKIHSIKFPRPGVALVDGSIEATAADASKTANRYAVIWVKSGDGWLISSARDLPTDVNDLPSLAYAQLKSLEWLVGVWHDASDKIDVRLECRWDLNKSFLLMQYEVKRPGEEPLQVTQRVGWDGHNGLVRSWVFDSQGGFGEGYWGRDGNRWVVGSSGVLPDGGTGEATNVYEFVDANNFVWRALDRQVDDQPLADAEVKFVRTAAK